MRFYAFPRIRDIVSYEIFDILGKNVVNSRKASGEIENVSVSDFTSGLYFVNVC